MTRLAPPVLSRDLLRVALQAYAEHCRHLGCALSDGPDLSPASIYASGRATLEARLAAEPFPLPRARAHALLAAIDALREARPVEEEFERLELFPGRVLGLMERRREPHGQRVGGRRWLDGRLGRPRGAIGVYRVRSGWAEQT